MDKIQQEMQLNMIDGMMSQCKEKTMKSTHTARELSNSEQQAFMNCLMKYNEMPNIVMQEMQ